MVKIDKSKFDPFYLAVAVLALIIVICAVFTLVELLSNSDNYHTEPDDLIYDAKYGHFDYLIDYSYTNKAKGYDGDKYKTAYAIVDYLEAGISYNAYIKTGDEEAAKPFKEQMDKAYNDMGELKDFFGKKIDKMFE